MTGLKQWIARLIETAGPIGVADYMALCLFDPKHGYYATREPFGVAGDFTTAPEISQMFGEMIGVWACSAWIALGRPMPVTLAEIGPGRGTLMKDMLRTLTALDREFADAARIAMIETSPRLVEIQKATLAGARRPEWHASISTLAEEPLILVGNELFDAIPVRQYIKTASGWRERMVGAGAEGELDFIAGAGALDETLFPTDSASAPLGSIVEVSPAREALMEEISLRIARDGGAALFIDYGHVASAIGDTLQAVRRHAFDDVLAHPGEADLTAHVDFAALARTASAAGLGTALMTQGEFLLAMGMAERAGRLGAAGTAERERISGEAERLAGSAEMGKLFKTLCIFPAGAQIAPFAGAD